MNALDFSSVAGALPYLWSGLEFSCALTAVTFVIGLALGTLFAVIQQARIPLLSQIIRTYIALVRSIPLILVLFWFFFLVPLILGHLSANGRPVPINATATAYITFALFEAAYYSEIVRVGLRSVGSGQFEAARSLCLPTFQLYRLIVMPQAFRVAAPIILSQTIVLFQDTSLVYVLSLTDLLGAASKLAQLNGRFVEMYVSAALVYLVICSAASQLVSKLRRRALRASP